MQTFESLFCAPDGRAHSVVIGLTTEHAPLVEKMAREVARMCERLAAKADMEVLAFRRIDSTIVELPPLEDSGFAQLDALPAIRRIAA